MRTYAQLETYLNSPETTLEELHQEHTLYYEGSDYEILNIMSSLDLIGESPSMLVTIHMSCWEPLDFETLAEARAYIIREILDQAVNSLD